MKILIKRYILPAVLLFSLVPACKMDTVNPNAPTDEEVLTSREGIIALCVGMRQFWSTDGIEATTLYSGVTSREMKGVTTFTNVLELEAGGAGLPTFNGNVLGYWSRMQRLMLMAQDVLDNAPNINTLSGGMRSGVLAYASFFKALSIASLAQAFEQVNINVNRDGNVTFVTRQQALTEAVRLLTEGISAVTADAPTGEFVSTVSGSDFDLVNCLYAYRARYQLYAGDYAGAIASANAVDLSKRCVYKYNDRSLNPVYNRVIIAGDFKPRIHFGLPSGSGLYEPNDQRISFFTTGAVSVVNTDSIRVLSGFFTTQTSDIPVYLPDEMRLIKAESILRSNGSTTDALAEINAVRTQTSGDPFGIYPGLAAYAGDPSREALLVEVYRQRCAELFLSGQKWEDTRRFNRPAAAAGGAERNRNFYPYPDQERLNNPNTPADPAI
ncbi:MAG: RagB/SusD family nutrient uptake outer membrane protein [Mucilaginibacter polytrichastri]|nr:RagB/SusD family nutrient uptake outer membrane protein [Mucilaginibacter polytrichastri]